MALREARAKDAVLTDQTVILHAPGDEGDQVDSRQQTWKQPADDAVASAMGFEPGEGILQSAEQVGGFRLDESEQT